MIFFFSLRYFKCQFWFSCILITELISDLKIHISMVEEDGERRNILNLLSSKDYTAVQLSDVNKRKMPKKVKRIISKTYLFSLIHSSLYLFDCYDVIISPAFQTYITVKGVGYITGKRRNTEGEKSKTKQNKKKKKQTHNCQAFLHLMKY